MSVEIVAGSCAGSGQCTMIAPETFARRVDGTADVRAPRPAVTDRDAVLRAARYCPEGAIRVVGSVPR